MSSVLRNAYAAIAELWLSPADIDAKALEASLGPALAELDRVDPEAARLLERFLASPIAEEDYVELFELDPKCALYLGSHRFEEPKSCSGAGVSDRNGYMIELRGMYHHLGFALNGKELPDYLPAMVDVLALTAGSPDPIRDKLIGESMLPLLEPLRDKLAQLDSPYLHLLDALRRVLALDLGTRPQAGAAQEMTP